MKHIVKVFSKCFNTADTFNLCSATGVQMVSSSGQKPVTPSSSSSASSTKRPVSHEAREKVYIKQKLGSDDKSLGECSCFFFCFFLICSKIFIRLFCIIRSSKVLLFNRNCQTVHKSWWGILLLWSARSDESSVQVQSC